MRRQSLLRFTVLCLTSAALPLSVHADPKTANPGTDDSGAVQSTWKPQEIRYSYVGFTTAYDCDAAEDRLKDILLKLGAHPQTQVRATGCNMNRPSKNFFITITTATPVAVTARENVPSSDKSEQELIKRLGIKGGIADEQFPARWETVNLSTDRKLDLKPGDCELMQGLRDRVLPSLAIKVVTDRVQCTPHHLDIQTPELTVSALVPVPSADKVKSVT